MFTSYEAHIEKLKQDLTYSYIDSLGSEGKLRHKLSYLQAQELSFRNHMLASKETSKFEEYEATHKKISEEVAQTIHNIMIIKKVDQDESDDEDTTHKALWR